jgi:hypothetical protein
MASEPHKKRELIFISLAVVGLVYGAVDYFMRSKIKSIPTGKDGVLAEATFSLISEELNAGASSKQEANAMEILNTVSAAWPENVFVTIASIEDGKELDEGAPELEEAAMVYSGYMNMGEKLFAVINGIEYRVGDMVEGFLVKEIDPMEIIMEKNGRPTHVPLRIIE